MNSDDSEKLTKDRSGVFVRLNEQQRNLLEKESFISGWTIPSILRDSYFQRLPLKLTFDKDGENKFLAEFRRIGNNINQLARAANSGDLVSGSDLESVKEQLRLLFLYVMRMDGVHKNPAK